MNSGLVQIAHTHKRADREEPSGYRPENPMSMILKALLGAYRHHTIRLLAGINFICTNQQWFSARLSYTTGLIRFLDEKTRRLRMTDIVEV